MPVSGAATVIVWQVLAIERREDPVVLCAGLIQIAQYLKPISVSTLSVSRESDHELQVTVCNRCTVMRGVGPPVAILGSGRY